MRPKNYDPVKDGAISQRALISVLEDLKREKVFTFNSHELQLRKVSYSTQLNSALTGIGLIDKYSKRLLVSDFNIGEIIKKVKLYTKKRVEANKQRREYLKTYETNNKVEFKNDIREMTDNEVVISKVSDSMLVKELRDRGYEVKAIKMIEL